MDKSTSDSREMKYAIKAGGYEGHLLFMAQYFDDLFHEEQWIAEATKKTFKDILQRVKNEATC